MGDSTISSSLGPGLDRMKSEVTSLIIEQQAEHEKRIVELLVAHQQHFVEAMRAELAKVALADRAPDHTTTNTRLSGHTRVETSGTPEASSEMATCQETGDALGVGQQSSSMLPTTATSKHVDFTRSNMSHTQRFDQDVQIHRDRILEHSFNSSIGKLVQLPIFEGFVCFIVVLNAISIGWYADWTMRNLYASDEPEIFRVLDVAFASAFVVELMMRIVGEGWHFLSYVNRNRPWNILDTVLVVAVVLEELLAQFLVSFTIVRMLRMLRAVRVLRIMRITRFFTELRVMVKGLISAARTLFWVIVLLFCVIYMFSVCIMQLTADTVGENGARLNVDRSVDELLEYIGSIESTVYTLYKSVTGGMDWGPVADLLAAQGWLLATVYSMYIAFAMLCILNIVTGVFVQNASTIANNDQLELGLEHVERRRAWMKEVMRLFQTADVNGNGQIDWRSFRDCLRKPSVQALFSQLGVDLESISTRGLFCLFDTNDDGTIDLEEFAHGMLKLQGTARSFDLHQVSNDNKRILQHVQQMKRRFP